MSSTTAPTSHKKKKLSQKESPSRSLQSKAALRLASTDSLLVITPPVVTQTQHKSATLLLPPSSPLINGHKTALDQLPSPPAADKRALAQLVSGYKPSKRYKSLSVHRDSLTKMKVAKLTDNVLFTFLRDPIVDEIAHSPTFKPIRPSDHIRKANSHFEKIGYDTTKSKHPMENGKSRRIATNLQDTKKPAAKVRRVSANDHETVFPDVAWDTALPALSHRHCW